MKDAQVVFAVMAMGTFALAGCAAGADEGPEDVPAAAEGAPADEGEQRSEPRDAEDVEIETTVTPKQRQSQVCPDCA